MQAPEVHPTPSIRVIVEGNDATDHPVLVLTMPVAVGDDAGAAELAAVCPMARQMIGPVLGHKSPSSVAVVLG